MNGQPTLAAKDANGDHPAGTYMLNPELRQHGGPSRVHSRLDTKSMPWEATGKPGVMVKPLYSHPEHEESMRIEKWEAGAKIEHPCSKLTEILVLEGEAHDGNEVFEKQSWLSTPAGGTISMTSATGCEVFVKEGEWRPPVEKA
eukprot:jgi/Undpi1/9509/HiC_scaffold_27.g11965.m1